MSKGGIVCTKLVVNHHSFDASTKNNIIARDEPNASVFKDMHDADSTRSKS